MLRITGVDQVLLNATSGQTRGLAQITETQNSLRVPSIGLINKRKSVAPERSAKKPEKGF